MNAGFLPSTVSSTHWTNYSIFFTNPLIETCGPKNPGKKGLTYFFRQKHVGVSKNNGTPKWMVKIRENPIKMDDLGGPPLFLETSMCFWMENDGKKTIQIPRRGIFQAQPPWRSLPRSWVSCSGSGPEFCFSGKTHGDLGVFLVLT